jgi:hypothetical protein
VKPGFAYFIAAAAAIAEIVLVTALWIIHLRTGPPLDAWVAGPMVVILPAALLFLMGAWLILRGLFSRRIAWTGVRVMTASALFAYVVTAIFCGPLACFQSGPNRAMGWFVVLGVVLAAVTHHLLLSRLWKPTTPSA